MITPLLIHKEKLVNLWLHAPLSEYVRGKLLEAIQEVDELVDSQEAQDRAHREEVQALIQERT